MATDSTNTPQSLADQVASLASGEWAKLDAANAWTDVAVTRTEHDQMVANGSEPFWGWGGPNALFKSWSSGAFDAQENRMFFMGGGRTNYGGNEVYQFDFDTLEWSRVTDPSPLTVKDYDDPDVDGASPDDVYIPADAPNSAHTYDGLTWNPVTGSFWMMSTSIGFDQQNGASAPRNPSVKAVWELDVESGEWTQHDASLNARFVSSAVLQDTGQMLALHNESSHDVFAHLYDADGTEHDLGQVKHPDGTSLQWGRSLFSNPETNEHYVTSKDGYYKIEIQNDLVIAKQALEYPSIQELGAGFPFQQAGYAYRPVDDKFYIWNGGARILRWDPDSADVEVIWNEEAPEAPPEAADSNGRNFEKWAYLEEADAFAGVVEGESFIWRPGDNPPDINEADVGSLQVDYQTTGALGVFLPLQGGEKDRDSSVSVAYREAGTSTWQNGTDLLQMRPELNSVSSPSPEGYAGSIFGLNPDTTYEIRTTVTDPDGVQGAQTQVITAATRPVPTSSPNNPNVIKVDTVAALRQALDGAQPGDEIVLQPGDYDLASDLEFTANGTADDPVVVRTEDRDATTLDANNGSGFFVKGSNVVIEGFHIKNASNGVALRNVENVTIRDNRIDINNVDDRGQKGIVGEGNGIHIVNNQLSGPYAFGRIDTGGNDRGIDVGGHNVEVANNTLAGFLDAIAGGKKNAVGVEIHHNKILWATDNGIELDGGLRNVSAHDNVIANTSDAISAQPVKGGPAYVYDNVLYNVLRSPFKIKPLDDQPQGVYLLNNTIAKAGEAWSNDSGSPAQMTVANNLFLGHGTNSDGDTLRNLSDHRLLEMDHNGWLTDGDFRLEQGGKKDDIGVDSFADWRDTTPFGNNSVLLANDPVLANMNLTFDTTGFDQFRDPNGADFNLDPQSKAIDGGKYFPNINGDVEGAAPDLGAFEVGSTMPDYGASGFTQSLLTPTAVDDSAVSEKDGSIRLNVLKNDLDPNSDNLDVSALTQPAHGSVSLNADGTVTYTPDSGFTGQDRFGYTMTDNAEGSDSALVSVTVFDGNSIDPTDKILLYQSDVLAATATDGQRVGAWSDASGLSNDAFQTNSSRQPTLLESDSGASAIHFDGQDDVLRINNSDSLNGGGPYDAKTLSLSFRTGSDVDSRQVIYEQGATVRGINIYVENGKVYAGAWNLEEGDWGPFMLSGDVAADSVHTLTLTMDAQAGTLEAHLDGTSLGTKTGVSPLYMHTGEIGLGAMANHTVFTDGGVSMDGTDFHFGGDILDVAFTNTALTDTERADLEAQLGTDSGSLPASDSNTAPVTSADSATTTEGNAVTIDVLANDSDPDGDSLSVSGITGVSDGQATANGDGTVTYTPDGGFSGTESFSYTAADGQGGTATGNVDVTVEALPDAVMKFDSVTVANRLSDGDGVATWQDQALDNDASQATASRQPVLIEDSGGSAVRFDGQDDVLRIDNSASLNDGGPHDAKTLAFSFRPGDDVDSRQVLYEQGGAWRGINVYLENGQVHASAWNSNDGTWGPFTLSGSVTSGSVHTLTLGFDASTGTFEAHLDGQSLGTRDGVGPLDAHPDDIGLGALAGDTVFPDGEVITDGVDYHFEGDVLDAVSYNQAVTTQDPNDIFG